MNTSLEQMASEMKKHKEFIFVYHVRPDGDCIGSSYALALAMKSLGAACRVEGTDEIPPGHLYMTDKVSMDEVKKPVYFSVDSATPERTGSYSGVHYTFCIDHHCNNSVDADFKYVEEGSGACGEVAFKLIKALGVEITPQIADFLYLALVMDTMCFRTSSTSVQSFSTAAELAKLGADIYGIGHRHVYIKKPGRVKIERVLQNSYHFTCDNQIVTGIITQNDLKEAEILDSELEGINSLVEQIEGMKIGITIRELADGSSRCSTRSCGSIPANLICETHGGGGHMHAACCVLPYPPDKARNIMEETAREFLYKA